MRQMMRSKAKEGNGENNAKLSQNYIPKIMPFAQSRIDNRSRDHLSPNKTMDKTNVEKTDVKKTVGKYYYKVI